MTTKCPDTSLKLCLPHCKARMGGLMGERGLKEGEHWFRESTHRRNKHTLTKAV